ncbi:takeout [Asbolus verrucosus]|uniref:Takeout n=1 Tax=Asbolus verrucosus TaxID=1661398 RepID=A0A482VYL8_ASBVE|nr:takeout [Asbolus verrucosus]
MLRTTLLVYLSLHLVHGILDTQPDYVRTCYKKDPNFINCSTHAVQVLFDAIPKGEPAIGLDPLDPLHIPKIKILQGGGGPVTVNASLSNVTVVGFGKTQVLYNSVDPVTYDFLTKLRLERLRIDGLYELLGRILVIPLRGKGSCWFDAKNIDIVAKSDVTLEKRDGFHFYNVTAIHVKFSIGGLKLHMGNLFDGIKALEESTNAYLNANWKPVAESLNPILSKTIEDIMIGILKRVFDNIPADFFIADIED